MRLPAFLTLILLISGIIDGKEKSNSENPGDAFTKRVVAMNLSDPWEITYGPDSSLWTTEAKGYRVSRINPETGRKKIILDLNALKDFGRYDKMKNSGGKPWPQGGLMGLALHPQLLRGKPFVYLSYIYHFAGKNETGNGCLPGFKGCHFKGRIVRYTYDVEKDTLIDGQTLCDTIPASNDHNGGRLLVAPVQDKYYLFYAIGDLGAGQFDNGGRPNHAQESRFYQGKILRFNAEPDNEKDQDNPWIPDDNPSTIRKVTLFGV